MSWTFGRWPEIAADSCVGDDDVELGDVVVGFEVLDGGFGVAVAHAVDFDDDELGVGGVGQVEEGLGGGCWVADCCDDEVVGAGEVGLHKFFPDT